MSCGFLIPQCFADLVKGAPALLLHSWPFEALFNYLFTILPNKLSQLSYFSQFWQGCFLLSMAGLTSVAAVTWQWRWTDMTRATVLGHVTLPHSLPAPSRPDPASSQHVVSGFHKTEVTSAGHKGSRSDRSGALVVKPWLNEQGSQSLGSGLVLGWQTPAEVWASVVGVP